jgi:hypothetical protein
VTQRQPDSGGDYGYDLVHEDVAPGAAADRPGERAGTSPLDDPPGRRREEPSGDLGYDEAHDF